MTVIRSIMARIVPTLQAALILLVLGLIGLIWMEWNPIVTAAGEAWRVGGGCRPVPVVEAADTDTRAESKGPCKQLTTPGHKYPSKSER